MTKAKHMLTKASCLVPLSLTVGCLSLWSAVHAGQAEPAAAVTSDILHSATLCDDWLTSRRAVQQAMADENIGQRHLNDIAAVLGAGSPGLRRTVCTFIVTRHAGSLTNLLALVQSHGEDTLINEDLLLTIGILGSRAAQTEPVLRRVVQATNEPSSTKALASTLLASLDNRSSIDAQAAARALARGGADASAVLRAVRFIGQGTWLTDDISAQITNLLGHPSPLALEAVVTTCAVSTRDPHVPAMINALLREIGNEDDSAAGRLILNFALAKLDTNRASDHIVAGLRCAGGGDFGGHTDTAALLNAAWFLVDEQALRHILAATGSADPALCLGAIKMIWAIGLPASNAAPYLLNIAADRRQPEQTRGWAFNAIGVVAPPELASSVERLTGSEGSNSVREQARKCLSLLRLQCQGQ
jgi:hypothetical protein